MFPRTRVLMSLALIVVVAACSKSTATGPAGAGSAVADTAAPSVAASPTASTAPAAAPAPSPGFTLTMTGVDAYLAAMGNLAKLADKNPAIDDLSSMNASTEDSTQYAARLRKHPEVVAAITSAGLSVDEFAQTGEALVAGMMTAGALDSGAVKKIPDGVNPQFVEFAKQNKAALDRKFKAAGAH